MLRKDDIKSLIHDTLELLIDDVEYLLLEKMTDEQWNNVINSLKHELNIVGIKVG